MEGVGMDAPDQEPMVVPNNSGENSSDNNSNGEECSHVIVKGKRTKRQRAAQQLPAAAASTSSAELSGSTTEEEEDMANCLILLAHSRAFQASTQQKKVEETVVAARDRPSSRRLVEAATGDGGGKGGVYLYECKTCGKCFSSFQALGGHRTSHKKPKIAPATAAAMEEKKNANMEEDNLQIGLASSSINPITAQNANVAVTTTATATNCGKSRVHECSICGSEFSSGQALGGHMRRHRPAATAPGSPQEPKKEKNLLSLDLNLPAPQDDDRGVEFPAESPSSSAFPRFPSKPPAAAPLFTASALVDCHY